jgi:predicted DCC family thiol-disulfide oxidoreductase YuxK
VEKIKVYYNSACPVCKLGIEGQQCRMAAQNADEVEWLDVHADPALAHQIGSDLETVRERLHVVAPDGSLRVGADAFAVLFSATRSQRWLGRMQAWPVLRPVSILAYNVFARLLYWWNRALHHW